MKANTIYEPFVDTVSPRVCTACSTLKPVSEYKARKRNRKLSDGTPYVYVNVPRECYDCEKSRAKEFMTEYRHTPEGQEACRAAGRKYYKANKPTIKQYWQSDRGKEIIDRYNKTENGWAKNRARWARKTAKLYNLPPEQTTLTGDEVLAIARKHNFTCAYCLNKPALARLTIDHVTPFKLGGVNVASNVVPACDDCNEKKLTQVWVPRAP